VIIFEMQQAPHTSALKEHNIKPQSELLEQFLYTEEDRRIDSTSSYLETTAVKKWADSSEAKNLV
jgi:hypothetical protein